MSIDMNTLISQMIMFFVILGCGFVGAKLGLLKAEVIHGLSSLLMGVICPLMLIAVFPSAVQEENAWPVVFVIIIKLIVMPVVIFRVMTWLGVNDLARNIWTLIIALPSMASIPIMAESFGSIEADYAAQGVFIITLASLVTIPLVVMLCR